MAKTLADFFRDAAATTSSAEYSLATGKHGLKVNEVYPFDNFKLPKGDPNRIRPAIIAAATVNKITVDRFGNPVKDPAGVDVVEHFTTTLALTIESGVAKWSVWCRDKFQEGRDIAGGNNIPPDDRIKACANCTASANRIPLTKGMKKLHNSRPVSASCDFWTQFKIDESLCPHVIYFLKQLVSAHPDFEADAIDQYDLLFGTASSPTTARAFDFERTIFKNPIGIKGEQGSGKTYDAFALAKKHGLPLFLVAGNEGTETSDLKGYLVPHASGLVWKDGPMAAAFRAAKTDKALLVVDEILRIPTRELSLFLTALSKFDGHYRFRTGRMLEVVDGVGQEEELIVPCENLLVFVTTNVGSQFAINDMDPAMEERFVWFYRKTEESQLKKILQGALDIKGYSTAKAEVLLKFFRKMKELKNKGMVRASPTTRPLVRAIELCDIESELPATLKLQMLYWVGDTAEGEPIAEQMKPITDLIDAVFK